MAKTWVKKGNLKGPKGDVGTFYKRNLLATDDLNTFYGYSFEGAFAIPSDAAVPLNAPAGAKAGNATVTPVGSGASSQVYVQYKTATVPLKIWARSITSTSAGSWGLQFPLPDFATRTLSPVTDLTTADTWTEAGEFDIRNGSGSIAFGLPYAGASVFKHVNIGVAPVQFQYGVAPSQEIWYRAMYANGLTWGAWSQVNKTAASTVAPASAAGLKSGPVPLTAGHSGGDAALSGAVRMPLKYSVPWFRFKLRFQDINPRYGAGGTRTGAVDITGIWYGAHAGAGAFSAAPKQLAGAFTIPDGAVVYDTPWFNEAYVPDTEQMISYGYSKATAPNTNLAYAFTSATSANGAQTAGTGFAQSNYAPFNVTLIVETSADVPFIPSFGDSNSVGVGTTNSLHDSWLSKLCRRVGAFPVHMGSSGDGLTGSQDATAFKYSRFKEFPKFDVALFALGQNTLADPAQTLDTFKAALAVSVAAVQDKISSNVQFVSYMPRTTDAWAGFESLRQSVNTYAKTLPYGMRDYIDIGAAISTDDLTITPAYDADGIHINSAGTDLIQARFTRELFTRPALAWSQSVGRTATATNRATGAQQLVYSDTGVRDIASSVLVGTAANVYLRRVGVTVEVYFRTWAGTAANGEVILTLPAGFRPAYFQRSGLFTTTTVSLATNGNISPNAAASALDVKAVFSTNDTWPASLPGVAVGTIPAA